MRKINIKIIGTVETMKGKEERERIISGGKLIEQSTVYTEKNNGMALPTIDEEITITVRNDDFMQMLANAYKNV